MKRIDLLGIPFLCVGVLAVAACNRDRVGDRDQPTVTDPGKTTVTGANVATVSNDSAITRLVTARCAREQTCNNVGNDKRYASSDVCTQKIRVDMKDDLNAKECPRGIDQKELDECLTEIRSESCNNPIEKIERLAACRTSDLCLKTGAPNH